jgi:hypothetical protein
MLSKLDLSTLGGETLTLGAHKSFEMSLALRRLNLKL